MQQDFFDRVRTWAELLGPNVYIQAVAIAIAFIFVGKIADFIISRVISRVVARSRTDLDDNLVALLHRPVFVSFVLLGLVLAEERMDLPAAPAFLTLGILKTIAIVVWYGFFSQRVTVTLNCNSARVPRSQTECQHGSAC